LQDCCRSVAEMLQSIVVGEQIGFEDFIETKLGALVGV